MVLHKEEHIFFMPSVSTAMSWSVGTNLNGKEEETSNFSLSKSDLRTKEKAKGLDRYYIFGVK